MTPASRATFLRNRSRTIGTPASNLLVTRPGTVVEPTSARWRRQLERIPCQGPDTPDPPAGRHVPPGYLLDPCYLTESPSYMLERAVIYDGYLSNIQSSSVEPDRHPPILLAGHDRTVLPVPGAIHAFQVPRHAPWRRRRFRTGSHRACSRLTSARRIAGQVGPFVGVVAVVVELLAAVGVPDVAQAPSGPSGSRGCGWSRPASGGLRRGP